MHADTAYMKLLPLTQKAHHCTLMQNTVAASSLLKEHTRTETRIKQSREQIIYSVLSCCEPPVQTSFETHDTRENEKEKDEVNEVKFKQNSIRHLDKEQKTHTHTR